jgi:Flp pilus assembly protein TadD
MVRLPHSDHHIATQRPHAGDVAARFRAKCRRIETRPPLAPFLSGRSAWPELSEIRSWRRTGFWPRTISDNLSAGLRPDPGPETPGSGEAWHHQTVDDPTDDRETPYELFQRGDDLLKKRHFAAAAIVLERASRAEPGKASILEALGRAYYNSGQHEASRNTFEALIELDPSAHYAHFALGQSLKQLGRSREARTHLRLAVALSPNSTLYAGALARLGPPEEG